MERTLRIKTVSGWKEVQAEHADFAMKVGDYLWGNYMLDRFEIVDEIRVETDLSFNPEYTCQLLTLMDEDGEYFEKYVAIYRGAEIEVEEFVSDIFYTGGSDIETTPEIWGNLLKEWSDMGWKLPIDRNPYIYYEKFEALKG